MIDNPPTLESFPLVRRVDAWQSHLAHFGLTAHILDGEPSDGRISSRDSSSGARLARISGTARSIMPARRDGRGTPVLLLQALKGRGTLRAGDRTIDFADDDLAVLDMEAAWRIAWRGDFDAVLLLLPRAPLASRLGRATMGPPVILARTFAALAARPVLRMLANSVDSLEQADLSAGELAVTELVASALLVESRAPNAGMTEVQALHFRRVAAAIDRNLADPDVTPADIARQEGMSVRYLQRLFQLRDDSFSGYLRNQRLERCRADLTDPNHARESIAAIGLRWGFRDQAWFSRAFSAAFGVSPSELRRSVVVPEKDHGLRGMPLVRNHAREGRT
ncbi:MAG: helix-turn-helix domain-containing protein, partial [Oricola sp.]